MQQDMQRLGWEQGLPSLATHTPSARSAGKCFEADTCSYHQMAGVMQASHHAIGL